MGILLVYDITNDKSFDNIKNWYVYILFFKLKIYLTLSYRLYNTLDTFFYI